MPEILAPGGDPDSVRAAILAGADAVYLGLERFNARMRAQNMSIAELAELARLAHSRGVRLFLTLNILFRQEELFEALKLGLDAWNAGADAIILQDWGLMGLFHHLYPEVEIHASTQITTHNTKQIDVLAAMGVRQINVCRELSLDEIGRLATRCHRVGIKVEVFVHGAYCISFSGQCYLSSFLCGLSGNRGTCVQPCRRDYLLASTAKPSPSAEESRKDGPHAPNRVPILNLKDNNALSEAPALMAAGVDSFKIEGRRKGFYYVHTIVRAWRTKLHLLQMLDGQERTDMPANSNPPADTLSTCREEAQTAEASVGQVFHRGFDIGYLTGHISPEMFSQSGDEDRSLVPLGRVATFHADRRTLRTTEEIPPAKMDRGDAIAIFADKRQERFIARLVIEERKSSDHFQVRIEHELKGRILRGQYLYGIPHFRESEALLSEIRSMTRLRMPLTVLVQGQEGFPLRAEFRTLPQIEQEKALPVRETTPSHLPADGQQPVVAEVMSSIPLRLAQRNPITADVLLEHWGKLGDTDYELAGPQKAYEDPCSHESLLDLSGLAQGLFLPISELNRMRRQAITILDEKVNLRRACLTIPDSIRSYDKEKSGTFVPDTGITNPSSDFSGHDLFLPADLLRQELLPAISDPRDMEFIRDAGLTHFLWHVLPGTEIPFEKGLIPWFPPIQMEGQLPDYLRTLEKYSWPMIVSDNSGLGRSAAERGIPWMAGPLLNLTNSWACLSMRQAAGAHGFVLSMELSLDQAAAVAGGLRNTLPDADATFLGESEFVERNRESGHPPSPRPDGKEAKPVTAMLVFGPILAMNTRQCLVRRFKNCRKDFQDRDCLLSCQASGRMQGDPSQNRFFASKQPGTYSQLWDARLLFFPDIAGMQSRGIDLALLDFRDPGFLRLERSIKRSILLGFRQRQAEALIPLLRKHNLAFCSGHFQQGLE